MLNFEGYWGLPIIEQIKIQSDTGLNAKVPIQRN